MRAYFNIKRSEVTLIDFEGLASMNDLTRVICTCAHRAGAAQA
jgi:hypothetical protein